MRTFLICMAAAAAQFTLVGMATADDGESWVDRLTIKGDMRFRYEYVDQDDQTDTRERIRGRVRLEMRAMANEDVDIVVRAASGSDDPVSSNQSFDGGFSTKDFRLDKGYIDYHPGQVDGLGLWFGKTTIPFVKVKDLLWDDDLNPEGIMIVYERDISGVGLFANAGWWWAEERAAEDDTTMWGAQLGGIAKATDAVKVTGGVSYYGWENTKGFSTLFLENDGFGNTTVNVGTDEEEDLRYVNDYTVVEGFGIVDIKTGFAPVKLYADYIVNADATTPGDTGYMLGLVVGKAKDPGSWEFSYNWRDLETDASIAAFVDSDSFGGGTNGQGSKLQGKYQFAKNWQTAVSLFVQELDPDGAAVDYTRLQIDLIAKF